MSAGTMEIVKSSIGRLLGLDGHYDSQESSGLGQYAPFLAGDGMRGFKLYPITKSFLAGNSLKVSHPVIYKYVFDDFLGYALDAYKWNVLKGSGATAAYPAITTGSEGTIVLTTGVDAAHTMAANGSQLVGALNFLVSNDETEFEANVGKISALTSQSICFGLTDAVSLQAPFTRTTATTTANATNAACFLQDAASTTTTMYAVSVNAGGTPQSTSLGVNVSTSAYHKYRIHIDAAGNAVFYIDGVLVATQLLAVATTAILTPTVEMFSEATSGSQTLKVDYILAQQLAQRG